MDDDEKGRRFLELNDEQNRIQWQIVAKLSALIAGGWSAAGLREELESLAGAHAGITREINSLDDPES